MFKQTHNISKLFTHKFVKANWTEQFLSQLSHTFLILYILHQCKIYKKTYMSFWHWFHDMNKINKNHNIERQNNIIIESQRKTITGADPGFVVRGGRE